MSFVLLRKNQNDDLKKQYYELQDRLQVQGEDHSRLLDEHRGRYDKLQQAKQQEVSQLKGTEGHIHEMWFYFIFFMSF